MSGIEGTKRLKRLRPFYPVRISTVFEDSEKMIQSLCAGASGYLVKNVSPEALFTSLDEHPLGSQQRQAERDEAAPRHAQHLRGLHVARAEHLQGRRALIHRELAALLPGKMFNCITAALLLKH